MDVHISAGKKHLTLGILLVLVAVPVIPIAASEARAATKPPAAGSANRNASVVDSQILPDGRLIVLTSTSSGARVLRFSKTGKPDGSYFFGKGFRNLPAVTVATGLARQGNRVVIYGVQAGCRSCNPAPQTAVAVRLKEDGSTDRKFGKRGKAELFSFGAAIGSTGPISASRAGQLLALGAYESCDASRTCVTRGFLLRISSRGRVDRSFGTDGIASMPASEVLPTDLLPLDDGSVLVSGNELPSLQVGQVVRFTSAGSISSEFGNSSGLVVLDRPVDSMTEGSGNRVLLAGDGKGEVTVRRISADGVVDLSYGEVGSFRKFIGPPESSAAAIVGLANGGALVVAGTYVGCQTTCRTAVALAKVDSLGQLVSAFGTGGVSVGLVGSSDSSPIAPAPAGLVVRNGRRLFAAGTLLRHHTPYTNVATASLLTGF